MGNPLVYAILHIKPELHYDIKGVLNRICDHFGVNPKEVPTPLRNKSVSMARSYYIISLRFLFGFKFTEIASKINRKHETAIHHCQVFMDRWVIEDPTTIKEVNKLFTKTEIETISLNTKEYHEHLSYKRKIGQNRKKRVAKG